MITVEEAKKIIAQEIPRGPAVALPLEKVCSRILAEEIQSPIDSPLFNASAMDGFGIHHEETTGASRPLPVTLKSAGLIAAGDVWNKPLGAGEAVHIMTGAMLPEGATAVIPQEEVLQDSGGTIMITREVKRGEHVRLKGEEIRKGDPVLPKETLLTPGGIGFLASLGIFKASVYAAPKVFVIPTGSELVKDSSQLEKGKIIESNSHVLKAALQELQMQATLSHPIPDIHKVLFAVTETALTDHDFILITGGVSVGSFDLVKEILKKLGVKTLFWQVAQKPGKPLYFGKYKSKFVFGLPGNPASSLVCFYEYVRPAILKWLGFKEIFLAEDKAHLSEPFQIKGDRAQFIRARAQKKEGRLLVQPLLGQESHRMAAFSMANCFMFVPKEMGSLGSGDEVTIHWLPQERRGLY